MQGFAFSARFLLIFPLAWGVACADNVTLTPIAAGVNGGAAGALGSAGGASTAAAGTGSIGGGASSSGASGTAGQGAAGTAAGRAGASGSAGAASSGGAGAGSSGGASAGSGGGASAGSGAASGSSGGTGGTGGSSGKKFCDLPPGAPTNLKVADGFCVRLFAAPKVVTEPRTIRIAPNGDVFIGSPASGTPGGSFGGLGAIVILPDDNHDGQADAPVIYAGGNPTLTGNCAAHDADPTDLTCAHGIAFIDGFVYVTRWNDVRRYPYKVGDRQASGAPELVATLGMDQPSDWRFTHTVDRAPNGDILVSRGRYDSSACSAASMAEGAVLRIPLGGGLPATPEMLSQGFRNPMYLRCHPTNGACFANELSGDGWDGVGGHEKLALLTPGGNWGYPCCVDTNKPLNGGTPELCATVSSGLVSFPLHDTPFGMDFDRGSFPDKYKNALFVADHGQVGSWTGSQVVWYPTDANGMPLPNIDAAAPPKPFVTGFGHGVDTVNGRATDVAFAPDGRMFIIDDASSEVWWVAPLDLESPAGW